jgi:hypothetical protein
LLKWQVYVPQDYQRNRPPGVFVYINPDGWGGIPDQWKPVFANEFAGAAYISGSAFWGDRMPDRAEALRRKYHVFITGTDDKAKKAVRRDYESYKDDGVQNVKLIFENGRFGKIPSTQRIEEALRYLDSHLA